MPIETSDTFKRLRVFVASPSDVKTERQLTASVIDELNLNIAPDKGCYFELLGWEMCRPSMGEDPQDVINRQLPSYDVFIGILWHRFGTPTKRAGSGTEEEFHIAYKRWQKEGKPEILFYFSNASYSPQTANDLRQWQKVLAFKYKVQRKGLICEYGAPNEFEYLVRNHLTQMLLSTALSGMRPETDQQLRIEDLEIEEPRFWNESHTARFSLCYFGEGLAYVSKIGIEVLSVSPCRRLKPVGQGATPQEYAFRVVLKPDKLNYQVNRTPFVYRKRDLDKIRIEMTSAGGYQYELRVYIVWHDKYDSIERRLVSHTFNVAFPVSDIDEAIRLVREQESFRIEEGKK